MPESYLSQVIEQLLSNASLSRQQKVDRLRELETDALAKQRGGSEGLEPNRPDDGNELQLIERALMSLGESAIDQGPASL